MPGVPLPPGYVRPDPKPDPKPDPDLPRLGKSCTAHLNDGTVRTYPTLADYVDYFVQQGRVQDLDDLVQNYSNLINEVFFNWIEQGQLGCLFAMKLAKNPRENRWVPIVQLASLSLGDRLGERLNSTLDAAAEHHEAAAIIFPDIKTEDDIVSLVNALCGDPSGRWYWTEDGIKGDPSGALKLIGLRWILKSETSVNFALGFAAISSMPQTRHSPFTTLFLRIRDEKRTPLHCEDGRVQVHLADLDSLFSPQERHDKVLAATEKARANMVEPHMDVAAKARVTFSVSTLAGSRLAQPKKVTIEKEQTED